MILLINQHNFNYLWKKSEENDRATDTHNCKAPRNMEIFYGFDLGVRALRYKPDVETRLVHNHIRSRCCARRPASPRWNLNGWNRVASRPIPAKHIRDIRKTTRLECVLFRRKAKSIIVLVNEHLHSLAPARCPYSTYCIKIFPVYVMVVQAMNTLEFCRFAVKITYSRINVYTRRSHMFWIQSVHFASRRMLCTWTVTFFHKTRLTKGLPSYI